jgi:uncharacterized membrane protein YphA (DoxX/SURF4 family)
MDHLIHTNLFVVLARLLVGFLFIFAVFWDIWHWQSFISAARQKKIIFPQLTLTIGTVWEACCSIMLLIGWHVALASLLLIPFTVIATSLFHRFWKEEGEAFQLHMTIFIGHFTVTLAALILLCVIFW